MDEVYGKKGEFLFMNKKLEISKCFKPKLIMTMLLWLLLIVTQILCFTKFKFALLLCITNILLLIAAIKFTNGLKVNDEKKDLKNFELLTIILSFIIFMIFLERVVFHLPFIIYKLLNVDNVYFDMIYSVTPFYWYLNIYYFCIVILLIYAITNCVDIKLKAIKGSETSVVKKYAWLKKVKILLGVSIVYSVLVYYLFEILSLRLAADLIYKKILLILSIILSCTMLVINCKQYKYKVNSEKLNTFYFFINLVFIVFLYFYITMIKGIVKNGNFYYFISCLYMALFMAGISIFIHLIEWMVNRND